jgi:hypothetical protein
MFFFNLSCVFFKIVNIFSQYIKILLSFIMSLSSTPDALFISYLSNVKLH